MLSDKITHLEQEQANCLKLSKEQIVVLKRTLKAVNRTLNDVSHNEEILVKGLSEIKKHIIEEDGQLNKVLGYTSMLITLREHAVQLDGAFEELQEQYSVLLQAVLHAQRGILQP